MSNAADLTVSDLVVEYKTDGYAIRPLDGLSFEAKTGELVVLLGPSGSGKTTLLSCLGGILTPTAGTIQLGDTTVSGLDRAGMDSYRRELVGFVFQAFNLIASLSARENVAVPLLVTGTKRSTALARADVLLDMVGLGERGHHRPSQLSGGQQQRVAVARGLAQDPTLLLADEPTANLDHVQAEAVIGLLRNLRNDGRTIVVSTHDARLVPVADRVIDMGSETLDVEGPPVDVRYSRGEVLFEQGDAAGLVYVVVSGTAEVFRRLSDGGEESLATRSTGEYFGELGSMLGFPRSASVRATSDLVVTAYSPDEFRRQVLGES